MSVIEAVQSGEVARVREALRAGGDVNEPGPGGRTPLIEAAAAGNAELVALLLEQKADPSLPDEEHETALLKAAAQGHRKVVELLAPLASEDERDMARAFMKALADPSWQTAHEVSREDKLDRLIATGGARVSKFFGDEAPAKRLERVERSEKKRR